MPVRRKQKLNDAPLAQLMFAQGGRCFYCGEPFSKRRGPTRDHLFPRSLGCDLPGNKVAAHSKCNSAKGSRMPTPEEVERASAMYAALGLHIAYRLKPVTVQVVYEVEPSTPQGAGGGE